MTDTATRPVAANRDRLSGVVQAVGRRPADIPRRRWESFAIFALFSVAYSAIGIWLVTSRHVVSFETLDRFDRALMILHNVPPKLSAVGFDYPPLSVVLVSPFAAFPPLTRSLVVVPISSAIFAALCMMFVNTVLRRATVGLPLRLAVLVGLGLNPLVVMYASTGARNFLWLAFVVAALGALFAWYVTADIRFVMLAGLAFGGASLTGYGSLIWFLVSCIMVAAILGRLGADGTEVEGTTVGFASPTVYAIALWTAFNLLLLTRPLAWLTDSSDKAAAGDLDGWSVLDIVKATGELLFYGAPIAIVVLPVLIFTGIARRNGFALWLGVMLLVSILLPGAAVALRLTDSPMVINNALPILFVSVIGGAWLARSAAGNPFLVPGVLAIGLLISIPWTFQAMKTHDHQGIERAFHDAIATGDSQEGVMTKSGNVVGYANERDMADYILDNVKGESVILTDNAQTYGVILLTGDPGTFFDRVDESDGPWSRAARNPAAHVDYLLLSVDTSRDLLSRLYPDAAAGDDEVLEVVHENERYRLVAVPEGYQFGDTLPDEDDANGNGIADDEEETEEPAEEDPNAELEVENENPGGYDGQLGEPPSTVSPETEDPTDTPTDTATDSATVEPSTQSSTDVEPTEGATAGTTP